MTRGERLAQAVLDRGPLAIVEVMTPSEGGRARYSALPGTSSTTRLASGVGVRLDVG